MILRAFLPILLLCGLAAGAFVYMQQDSGSSRGAGSVVEPAGSKPVMSAEHTVPEADLVSAVNPGGTLAEDPKPEGKKSLAASDEEFLANWEVSKEEVSTGGVPKNVDRLSYKVRSGTLTPEAQKREMAEKVMNKVHSGELALEELSVGDRAAYDSVLQDRNDRRNARRAANGLPPQDRVWQSKGRRR